MILNRSTMAFLLLSGVTTAVCAQKMPNIIYVFPDQFRNHAMQFWGEKGFKEEVNFTPDPVYTPNINRFAHESLVLTSAQSNCPVSSPHRGMLLTGMYPDGSGVPLNCNSSRPLSSLRGDVTCIADLYHAAGYNCAYIGKLHVDFPTPNDPDRPGKYVEDQLPAWDAFTPVERRHGFDYWYSYGTFNMHKTPHYWDTAGKRIEIREWSPTHEANKAIAYLENKNNERDSKKPFLLVWSINPPHSPYNSLDDVEEKDYNLYKDKTPKQLLVRPNVDHSMSKTRSAAYYFASVTGVDREFGRLLATIKELGLDDNTIVVFSSDHGETMCSQGIVDPKNSPYAESMNVPFLIRYPHKITPRVDHLLLSTPDIMPTLLGLSGLHKMTPATVQGKDLSPYLLGQKMPTPKAVLYLKNLDGVKNEKGEVVTYFPETRGIKTARYTLAISLNKKTKQIKEILFFDDKKDPYQLKNLSLDRCPKVKRELLTALASLLKESNDPWYRERILAEIIPYK